MTTPLNLDAIEADLDRRVPALDFSDRDHCRALLAEVRRVKADRDRLAATVDRVREVCAEHWEHQTRRERKFGRTGSSCICPACNVMRAVEGTDS